MRERVGDGRLLRPERRIIVVACVARFAVRSVRREAFQHFTDHDPDFLARLLDAWNRAEPLPTRVRESYRIIWNHERHGRMCFYCLATTANERDGLVSNDWIPVDAETWYALDALQRDIGLDPEAARGYLMRRRGRLEP